MHRAFGIGELDQRGAEAHDRQKHDQGNRPADHVQQLLEHPELPPRQLQKDAAAAGTNHKYR